MAKTITCLPEELIIIILSYNDITLEDVINFRCVCEQFRYAAKYDKFLERKLYQRWPNAKKEYENLKIRKERNASEENVLKEKESINFIEIGINCSRQLRNYMSQIIFHNYYKNISNQNHNSISIAPLRRFYENRILNMKLFRRLDTDGMKFLFFHDEIKNLSAQLSRVNDRDIIERYCNIKMFHYTKLNLVGYELDEFLKKPEKEQLLEQFSTLMAQYIQPQKDVCYSSVIASLDSIAQKVLSILKEKYPKHSIFSTSDETFLYWKNNNIDDNHWNKIESTQIMDTLQEYMFGNLNRFRPYDYFDTDFKYLCIDYILHNKCGDNNMLMTIYHSVARRLGLRCDVICLDEIHIFWKPKFVTNNYKNALCFRRGFKKFPNSLVCEPSHYLHLVSELNSFVMSSTEMLFEIERTIESFIEHIV